MIDTVDGTVAQQLQEEADKVFDKVLAAAQPGRVFSSPVVSGEYTVITASEVFAGGAFGIGSGTGTTQAPKHIDNEDGSTSGTGGGGAGFSHGRPMATIVIGPDGVKVRPIADPTKIALAAIGAWGTAAVMAIRLSRRAKASKP